MAVLEKHYNISNDWEGKRYLGIDLTWDYERRKVHLYIILYVKEALLQFNHAVPRRPQYQPHIYINPKYGLRVKYTKEDDASTLLTAAKNKLVQEVLGILLYCGCAIDSTMLTALGTIAIQQSDPTENTMQNVHRFLDYAATHPDAIITLHNSDMLLAGHINENYL